MTTVVLHTPGPTRSRPKLSPLSPEERPTAAYIFLGCEYCKGARVLAVLNTASFQHILQFLCAHHPRPSSSDTAQEVTCEKHPGLEPCRPPPLATDRLEAASCPPCSTLRPRLKLLPGAKHLPSLTSDGENKGRLVAFWGDLSRAECGQWGEPEEVVGARDRAGMEGHRCHDFIAQNK